MVKKMLGKVSVLRCDRCGSELVTLIAILATDDAGALCVLQPLLCPRCAKPEDVGETLKEIDDNAELARELASLLAAS